MKKKAFVADSVYFMSGAYSLRCVGPQLWVFQDTFFGFMGRSILLNTGKLLFDSAEHPTAAYIAGCFMRYGTCPVWLYSSGRH